MSILCAPPDSNELRLLHQFVPVPCFVSTLELSTHLTKITRERDFQRSRLTGVPNICCKLIGTRPSIGQIRMTDGFIFQ